MLHFLCQERVFCSLPLSEPNFLFHVDVVMYSTTPSGTYLSTNSGTCGTYKVPVLSLFFKPFWWNGEIETKVWRLIMGEQKSAQGAGGALRGRKCRLNQPWNPHTCQKPVCCFLKRYLFLSTFKLEMPWIKPDPGKKFYLPFFYRPRRQRFLKVLSSVQYKSCGIRRHPEFCV